MLAIYCKRCGTVGVNKAHDECPVCDFDGRHGEGDWYRELVTLTKREIDGNQ